MTNHDETTFELQAGALRLAVRADLGGCIAGLWHGDTPILRSTEPSELQSSRKAACYPLVPYSNRIGYRRFSWLGHDYTTQPNFDDSPHSVHGVGWLRPWQVVAHSAVDVTLRQVHTPDADWPFAFEATQHFTLSPESLGVRLVITNMADIAQPVGLGWHPYFVKREHSRLHIEVSDRWDSDAGELPVRKVAQPGIDSDVAQLNFDNCFDGFHGPARIGDEKFSMQLTSSCEHLVIYTPQDKPYFCVEPVSHVSNAINMADPLAHGLRSLPPGESFEAAWKLEVSPPVIEADPNVTVAVAAPSTGGESPFWHPREQALYFVDIPGCRLNRFDPKTQALSHWQFESNVACCAPCLDGGLIIAMRDGVWHFDPATAELKELAEPPYDIKNQRFNDGKCDPQGRFWVGTIYEPRHPALAALYCFDGGELKKKLDGITNLNGLGWSPSGRTMYWSDTRANTIYAADFDPATAELSARRIFASFPPKPDGPLTDDYGGRPDGAAVDAEGCYWASLFEGGRVVRLSPDGEVLREVRLPVRCPTMPCFGGADLRTLYIATSRENRPAAELAEQPFAGCVLSLQVDVPGLPVNLFG